MPPTSPCLSSNAANTLSRQRHPPAEHVPHRSFDENEPSRDRSSGISIVPMVRKPSQGHAPSIRRHPADDPYFSATHSTRSRAPVDFQKKVRGVYVLPVSPALSSSSSSSNTDEIMKSSSSTMPIRSRRQILSAAVEHAHHHPSSYRGIKNDSFTASPQLKDRTLPRSHGSSLKRMPPPAQPPPLPPASSSLDFDDTQSSFLYTSSSIDVESDTIARRFSNQNPYAARMDHPMTRAAPPPVPSRFHKSSLLPIGFEELSVQPDRIGFRVQQDLSPQDEYSEHAWPKPPESMATSQIGVPLPPVSHSISYDRLHHDHLMASATHCFRQQMNHSMLTESDT